MYIDARSHILGFSLFFSFLLSSILSLPIRSFHWDSEFTLHTRPDRNRLKTKQRKKGKRKET